MPSRRPAASGRRLEQGLGARSGEAVQRARSSRTRVGAPAETASASASPRPWTAEKAEADRRPEGATRSARRAPAAERLTSAGADLDAVAAARRRRGGCGDQKPIGWPGVQQGDEEGSG